MKLGVAHPPIALGAKAVTRWQRGSPGFGQYVPGHQCWCVCVSHAHSTFAKCPCDHVTSREHEKLFEEIFKLFPLTSAIMTTT